MILSSKSVEQCRIFERHKSFFRSVSQLSEGAFCSSREVFNCIMFLPIVLIQRRMPRPTHKRNFIERQTETQKKYTKTFWAISRPCKPCNLWSVVELGSLSKTGRQRTMWRLGSFSETSWAAAHKQVGCHPIAGSAASQRGC